MMLVTCTPCSLFLRADFVHLSSMLGFECIRHDHLQACLVCLYLSYMTCNVPAAYAPYASGDGLSTMP